MNFSKLFARTLCHRLLLALLALAPLSMGSGCAGEGRGAKRDAVDPGGVDQEVGTAASSPGAPGADTAYAVGAAEGEAAGAPRPASRSREPAGGAPAYDLVEDSSALAKQEPARERPGLGTSYGEEHSSSVHGVSFVRRNHTQPDVMMTFWYDDGAGIEASARAHGAPLHWGQASTHASGLNVRVVDEYGRPLPGGLVGSRHYAAGQPGQRYFLEIENATTERFEVVASVDGLDVLDGSDANVEHRGYVVEPWSSLRIDGWRTSMDSVAAFRFSAVEDSYATRTGRGRDVGVIGFAFFAEATPPRTFTPPPPAREHDSQRDRANPFPG